MRARRRPTKEPGRYASSPLSGAQGRADLARQAPISAFKAVTSERTRATSRLVDACGVNPRFDAQIPVSGKQRERRQAWRKLLGRTEWDNGALRRADHSMSGTLWSVN